MLHPDVLKWASHCGIPIESVPESFEWEPSTLKQISTRALLLGKVSSHLVTVMTVLAGIELRLKNLRNGLGISRSHPESGLLRSTVLVPSFKLGRGSAVASQIEWTSLGGWIPDLLDRAAAFDPLHSTEKRDRVVSTEELSTYSLDHVILLDLQSEAGPSKKKKAEMERFNSEALNVQALNSEALNELVGLGCRVHQSGISQSWVSSGPDVFNAVFEAAYFIHEWDEVS